MQRTDEHISSKPIGKIKSISKTLVCHNRTLMNDIIIATVVKATSTFNSYRFMCANDTVNAIQTGARFLRVQMNEVNVSFGACMVHF